MPVKRENRLNRKRLQLYLNLFFRLLLCFLFFSRARGVLGVVFLLLLLIDHDAMSLSEQQLSAISVTERVCSAISLLGTSIIVVTFLASKSFRKPINRLVFYASWGNIMTNIATLVSQSGIQAGTNSCLCRFQAFFIQWWVHGLGWCGGFLCGFSPNRDG